MVVHALEARELSLHDSLALFESFKADVFSATGEAAERVKQKFESVLERNSGSNAISVIRDILAGDTGPILYFLTLVWIKYNQ